MERVWLYMRERFLSHRLHADYAAVLDAACQAWNRITPERLRSLTSYPVAAAGQFIGSAVSDALPTGKVVGLVPQST